MAKARKRKQAVFKTMDKYLSFYAGEAEDKENRKRKRASKKMKHYDLGVQAALAAIGETRK